MNNEMISLFPCNFLFMILHSFLYLAVLSNIYSFITTISLCGSCFFIVLKYHLSRIVSNNFFVVLILLWTSSLFLYPVHDFPDMAIQLCPWKH